MTRNTVATERPLRRDAERNRQRIIVAAREVFRERGMDTTLDDIAHRAGLGVGTVYRRFPNKEHLVEAMFADRLEGIGERMSAALDRADPWQALLDFLWEATALIADDRGLHDVMLSTAFGQHKVATARDKLLPLAEELIRRAKQCGKLRPDFEPEDMLMLFKMIGAAAEYTHHVAPDQWRRYAALLFDSLRAETGPPTPLPVPALGTLDMRDVMKNWCR
ncbi:TetR/AcrR family transcriptional regulator [Amycolatopsis pithecellobii]|uniref:TetR family transcriptional regulator n=1 Tax=Amycolatopsis pithecellobii TaxID=664692 RepID=A0A6N7YSX7_9PSEU|nr:TetR/AcrR family transcriptional regulator [Amycolatopsis pithecellobii]MTD55052.1 TetR family transcriptional regulator [Amycolatopsis pithecellobii]